MHIVQVSYSWPAETFVVNHAVAMAQVPDMRLTIAAKSPVRIDAASIRDVKRFPHPVVNLPNFDQLPLVPKLVAAGQTMTFNVPDGSWRARDKAIMQAFAELKPDVVHFHFAGLAAMLGHYVHALGIPYTVGLCGSDIQVEPLRSEEYAQRLCLALTNAHGIHAVCDDIAVDARRLCPTIAPMTTIRTCLPLPEHPANLPKPGLRFISVGRLHWRKSFHDLVRMMVYLPDATLQIIGDGPEEAHLLYLIRDLGLQSRVELCGKLPYEAFEPMLKNATAYVQSSVAEGFSNSVAEAMALGKAVFATDVGGTAELIRDGENGVLLPVGHPKAMAQIVEQARDRELIERLGKAARETALREFSMEKNAAAFAAFFRRVVGEAVSL